MKKRRIFRSALSLLLALALILTQTNMVFAAESITILAQPKDYIGTVSSDAVFTVTIADEGCSYRWQQKGPSALSWSTASGTGNTSAALTVRVRTALDGYSYRCQITDEAGNVYYSDTAKLQVSGSFQITRQPQNYEGLVGSTAVFAVATDTENLSYTWQRQLPDTDTWSNASDPGYRTNTLSVAVKNALDGYKYRCKITDADGKTFYTEPALLTVVDSFAILKQPENQSVMVGDTAMFSVSTDTEGLTYRWQQMAPTASAWSYSKFTGYNTASMSIKTLTRYHDYQFRCMITDANGGVVYSEPAALQVTGTFSITTQPADFTGHVGDMAIYTVETNSANLTYCWQYMRPEDSTWRNASYTGNRTNSMSLSVTNSVDGYRFRCQIKDADNTVFYTDTVTLTVQDSFAILKQPENQSVMVGDTATFSVSTDTEGLTYRWQQMAPTASTWSYSRFTGYNSASMGVKVLTRYNDYRFRCQITDVNGGVVYSEAAILKVTGTFSITKQPTDFTGFVGDTAVYSVETNSANLSYCWQYRRPDENTWRNASYTGNRTNSMSLKVTNSLDGYQFRCVITDADTTAFYTDTVKLTVKDSFQIVEQPQDCSAAENENIILTVETDTEGLSYRWQQMASTASTWSNSRFAGYNTPSLQIKMNANYDGYQFRCQITDANGGIVYSDPATVTLRGQTDIAVTQQPQNFSGKIGDTAVFTIGAVGDELSFQWQYRDTAEANWIDTTLTGYDTASLSVPITEGQAQFVYRCCVTDAYGNTVYSDEVSIVIEAVAFAITTQPEDYYGAVGDTAVFKVRAKGEGLSYLWQYRTSDADTWVDAVNETGYNTKAMCISLDAGLDNYSYRCIVKNSLGEVLETPAVSVKYLPVPEGYEDAYTYMSLLLSIDEKLSKLGLDWQMLKDMPQKDEAFYEDMYDILEREGADMNSLQSDDPSLGIPSSSANARAFALCYSRYAAEWSIAQEGDAGAVRDVDQEAMYMIISHYIDAPGMNMEIAMSNLSILDNSLLTNNEIGRWITDYDRQAYDTYLENLGASNEVTAWLTLLTTVGGIKAGNYYNLSKEIINANECLKKLDTMSDVLDRIQGGFDAVQVLISYRENAAPVQTPEELYELMKMDYMDDSSSDIGVMEAFGAFLTITSFVVNVAQFLAGNPFPLLLSVAFSMVTTAVSIFGNLYKAAAWAGMAQSRNMRISYRYMRMYGML